MIDIWKVIGGSGEVERIACWNFILADDELATLMGDGNQTKGKSMLEVMKAVRALDADGSGSIDAEEFRRLYMPSAILSSEEAVRYGLTPSYLTSL